MKHRVHCPIDKQLLFENENGLACENCGRIYGYESIGGKKIIDLRAADVNTTYTIAFPVPQALLSFEDSKRFGRATRSGFSGLSRKQILRKFGTKLHAESMFYLAELFRIKGGNISILDLGCGNGGTKRYLREIGFTNIVSVDYWSEGAEYLIDAHRLPFDDVTFDLIITTATLEHFANPFIAFQEMRRVLSIGGVLIATGSFWESWHGQSCFHFTPGGMYQLCCSSGFELTDVWSGWGFIPSTMSHATGTRKLKAFFIFFQKIFDGLLKILKGEEYVRLHRFRTAGALGIYAIRIN